MQRPSPLQKVRTFPGEHLQDLQRTAWNSLSGTNGWAGLLRRHRSAAAHLPSGNSAWTFPYAGRIYLLHRDPLTAHWCITLHETPDHEGKIPWDDLLTVVHHDTRRSAVEELVQELAGTRCDHRRVIGQDPCTGCEAVEDDYAIRY
ncbi:MAG TPA: hypothetical protein VIM84_11055 [Gemmatimonadales bacterium]